MANRSRVLVRRGGASNGTLLRSNGGFVEVAPVDGGDGAFPLEDNGYMSPIALETDAGGIEESAPFAEYDAPPDPDANESAFAAEDDGIA